MEEKDGLPMECKGLSEVESSDTQVESPIPQGECPA